MPDCKAKLKITAKTYSTSHNGYACLAAGGHCVPTKNCDKLEKHHVQMIALTLLAQEKQTASD